MREITKRGFLRNSGIAASSLIAVGSASASVNRSSEEKLRLRGKLSNPISRAEILEKRKTIINDSSAYANRAELPLSESPELPNGYKILAYNFDIIDGTPTEWTGIYKETENSQRSDSTTPTPDNSPSKKEETVNRLLDAAAADATERADKREAGSAELTDQSDLTSPSAVEDDWDSWTLLTENDNLIVTSDGNDMSWESKWKKDPDNSQHQGMNTELTMRPYNEGLYAWENKKCKISNDFNDSVISDVDDYGPGNSIGSGTTSFELTFSSDEVVAVGVSSSLTSSNLDIDNKSDTDEENVTHKYTINGDLTNNTVRVNQSSITSDTSGGATDTYCNLDLDAWFKPISNGYDNNHAQKGIRFYWK